MRRWLAVLLLSAPAWGQEAVPVTRELLERWGVPPANYAALSRDEKRALQRDLGAREAARLRKAELVRLLAEERCRRAPAKDCSRAWEPYLDAAGFLTEAGEKLLAEHEEALRARGLLVPAKVSVERADGRKLDEEDLARARVMLERLAAGLSVHRDPGSLGDELVWDLRVQNGTLRSLKAANPRTGASLEVGQLGVDGRHALLAPSWYANLEKRVDSEPDSWVDYRLRAQLGWVDLRSRWFAGPPPGSEGADRALELAGKLGVPKDKLASWSSHLDYDDPYRSHGMIVTSLLGQLGRAYNLWGPVDLAWAATSLTKVVYAAPNTALDETVGLRVKLPGEDAYFGLFGGATQNLSPLGNRPLQETLRDGRPAAGFHLENAPHATAALWGKAPVLSDSSFSLRATARKNRDTTALEGEASLMTSLLERPLAVRGLYSRERGPEIEFDREKVRAQADYALSDRALAYVAYERERILFGNAKVESDAFFAGLDVALDARATAGFEQVFGGRYEAGSPTRLGLERALTGLNRALTGALEAADKADALYEGIRGELEPGALAPRIDELAWSLSRLDPEAIGQLAEELSGRGLTDAQKEYLGHLLGRTLSATNPYYAELRGRLAEAWGARSAGLLKPLDDASAYFREHRADVAELIRLLTSEAVWDAVAVRAARAALLKAMAEEERVTVKVPALGAQLELKLDPPALLAAAAILQSRLSPVAPIRAGELDPWLLRQAARSLGLKGDAVTEDMIVQRLFGMASDELKKLVAQRVAPAVDRLAQDGAYDRAALAAELLKGLPPELARELTERFGPELQGLLPDASVGAAAAKDFLLKQLPERLLAYLRGRYGPELARLIAGLTAWAGELLRREINMTLIQLLLASEELNRLTVDRGLKAGDLGARMAMASFEKLDARDKPRARARLKDALARLGSETARGEEALAAKLTAYGKARLEAVQLDPDWPAGLSIAVADESWPALLSWYGDGPLFGFFSELAARRRAGGGAATAVAVEPEPYLGGTTVRAAKDGSSVRFGLAKPKDAKDAAWRLRGLADHLR